MRRCSNCGEPGHNRRTCRNTTSEEWALKHMPRRMRPKLTSEERSERSRRVVQAIWDAMSPAERAKRTTNGRAAFMEATAQRTGDVSDYFRELARKRGGADRAKATSNPEDHAVAPTYDFAAYAVGLCSASVCTSLPDSQATDRLNGTHPTGIASAWEIANEPFANGDANPRPCSNRPDTHRHLLFHC